jgi:DNA-binding IclR family transcriptional regulator
MAAQSREIAMARKKSTKVQSVRAVDRAIEILQCFTPDRPSMSVMDIQKRVPLSRPTLYRLLQTLTAKGLVRCSGNPQRFSLDYGVGRLASNWIAGIDAISVGQPILQRLREITNETAALFTLRGNQRLCVLEIPAPHILKISRGIGETEHIARGASGKAILASMSQAEIDPILNSLPQGTNRKQLLDSLQEVRAKGFAVSRAEVFAGAIAIAAPYFDHTGRVAGSIGVFGPQARVDEAWERKAIRAVVEAATELSSALGYATETPKRDGAARKLRKPERGAYRI